MDIKSFVAKRKSELSVLAKSAPLTPTLMIIQANDDPASNSYVRGKIKDGEEIGFKVLLNKLPTTVLQDELLKEVEKANLNPDIHGLIVQLPLPKQIDEKVVKLAIAPVKDVDGFHPLSPFTPCTPKGIVSYLEGEGFLFKGKNAVVLGRSDIVGKPMAKLLLSKDCNVTVLHSKTSMDDKRAYIKMADLIVVAIGRLGYLDHSFEYKPSAVIVDVGINRGEDGKLHGDAVAGLPVALQTPVPGGVGLLTRLALMDNLMEAANNELRD